MQQCGHVLAARERPEELLVYGRRYRSYRAAGNGTARLIIPKPFLCCPSAPHDDAGGFEENDVSEEGRRRNTKRREGQEKALLSYRNGVARSQPFNELGQLTLYAQSFPAFRFYVNFNSLRRTVAVPRKSVFAESVCPCTHS